MAELTPEDVVRLLEQDRAAELIGHPETETVEFKGEPYRLDDPRQRQELAKDVSALANGNGGLIVLGVRTEKPASHPADVVAELRPIPEQLVNPGQHEDVVRDWVYPSPVGVAARWFPTKTAAGRGLLGIVVPRQADSRRPFLVRRSVLEGDKLEGAIFGFFRRHRATAGPVVVEEVHSLMRDGLVFRHAMDQRGGEPGGAAPAAPPAPAANNNAAVETTVQRAAALVEAMELADQPTYVLTATPHPPVDASAMFASREHPIVELLRQPPEIRSQGFDLDTGGYPEIIRGEARRSIRPSYKALEFWRDGALVFVANGGQRFLSWGNYVAGRPYGVNQVTLIESVLLFCALTRALHAECVGRPQQVTYSLHLARLCVDGQRPLLWAGAGLQYQFDSDARQAPACDAEFRMTVPADTPPEAAAYRLVSEVYAWFGWEHDRIPYVDRSGPVPVVDPKKIAAIR